ncbi:daunorubicin resistance protein DrrA family ABC transporter ATP-binding protein [Alkalicoccus chagannorensis]|uniref:daunorubicin resistance protein DrrA family ABC transporter ATP-binding protein n=1 Tax=Alkalicoccus chagannorensis TaxID=427072 RepID=UPI0004245362|nr:daunorubicin resistance protein DrrA family ABC transporter ATP-binding protein [Alkalicoccus chagannorensis]
MNPIISVRGLRKNYKKTEAVKGIDFDVEEGEIFGFLGPNGAGKSTTINMICTMINPTSGSITINGYDVASQKARVRESIGIIFQENTLDEKLTAYENLMLHCRFYRVPKSERQRRIEEVLEIVDLQAEIKQRVDTFSGGMKRRLEIARGLLHYPKVLFLDEPTVGLDPQTRAHLWEYILRLKEEQGITMFLTTHYLDEAEISSRVAIMDAGSIIALDTPDALKRQLGGDMIELATEDNALAQQEITKQSTPESMTEHEGTLFIRTDDSNRFISQLLPTLTPAVTSLNIRRPTLNDVFLSFTGRSISATKGDG